MPAETRHTIFKLAYDTYVGPCHDHKHGGLWWAHIAEHEGRRYRVYVKLDDRGRVDRYVVMDIGTATEAALAVAQRLIDEGYHQVSAKYRRVARLPKDVDPLEFFKTHAPSEYQRVIAAAVSYVRRSMTEPEFMQELEPDVYAAFKLLGGPVG
jgi:hypothetical protein